MADLGLSIAIGDYDRVRPLARGQVAIDGVDPTFLFLEPEEIFFRAFRHAEFDLCELSLSSYTIGVGAGTSAYLAVPVFPSRAFRHTAIYVRKDRIRAPADLKGRRVGIPEYQLTANVWARALLEDMFGIAPRDLHWVQGGIDEPGRIEKIGLSLPEDVRIEPAPEGRSLSDLLEAGDIDAMIAPRAPRGFGVHPDIGWLFDDPAAAAADYFKATGIFPIMHVLAIRKRLVEAHPWLPASVHKAFTRAKDIALARLVDPAASAVALPFLEETARGIRALMGTDYWPYGLEANRVTLDAFLSHHHRQGLSPQRLAPEALFAAAALEQARI
ncbi:MAG TPA: ABC transporter substrate-binding protein [Allosphingosinicella sp.]|nr:ABC transporter substrate-binding protein [Allosphingosinicella sp.]